MKKSALCPARSMPHLQADGRADPTRSAHSAGPTSISQEGRVEGVQLRSVRFRFVKNLRFLFGSCFYIISVRTLFYFGSTSLTKFSVL